MRTPSLSPLTFPRPPVVGLGADCVRGGSESGRELGAGPDVKLVEHVGEVTLDGAGSDEQGLGDLAVCPPFSGQFGDATFAGGERFQPRKQRSARPSSSRAQLSLGPQGERLGA